MDLPEIRSNIEEFLSLPELNACALVCKAWNDFFTPSLYCHFQARNARSLGMERHCVHVRKLRLDVWHPIPKIVREGPVTRVQELVISRDGFFDGFRPRDWPNWVSLLQRNPEIVKLTVQTLQPQDIVPLCPNLRELVLIDFEFSRDGAFQSSGGNDSTLWSLCQGLTRLTLFFNATPTPPGQLSEPPQDGLPKMRHLAVLASQSSVLDQIRLISACTNLVTLKWNWRAMSHHEANLDLNLLRTLFQGLPGIREFKLSMPLHRSSLGADWVRELIGFLPPLTLFEDGVHRAHENMEGLVKGPLSRHFGSLSILIIRGWKGVTSEDNHLILTSCRGLKIFESREYKVGQISSIEDMDNKNDSNAASTSKSGAGPLGWVCTGLSRIDLNYVHETPKKSRLFFDQLCSMKHLRYVVIVELTPVMIQWDDEASARYWKSGNCYHTQMVSTFPWMLSVWPRLEVFYTYESSDEKAILHPKKRVCVRPCDVGGWSVHE